MIKLFTGLIIMFPILSVYSTSINSLSVADFLLILCLPIMTIKYIRGGYKLVKRIIPISIFLYYIVFTMLIQILFSTNVSIISTIRFCIYIYALIIGRSIFDINYALKLLKITTITISIYVIIQFLFFKVFNTTLPWRVPGLRVMDESFILKESGIYYYKFYRPTGIFLEPTHLVQYLFVYLIYGLFRIEKYKKLDWIINMLIGIAIVLSGSSLGMIALLIILIIWCIYKVDVKKTKWKSLLLIISSFLILIIIIPIIIKLPYIEKIFTRVIGENGLNGAAMGYRFNSLSILFQENITTLFRMIGYGRGTNTVYFTAIPYLIYCNGILGVLIYLWINVNGIIYIKGYKKILLIVVFIISIGSEMIINFGVLFYYIIIFDGYKKNNIKD